VNHKVHLCSSGCLTLKCSGLWKTVMGPLASVELSPAAEPLVEALEWPLVELSGEMGMVLSGTGSLPLTEVVMMAKVDGWPEVEAELRGELREKGEQASGSEERDWD
jgi:hypothetical protein